MASFNHKSAVFFMAFIALLGWIALGAQLNLLLSSRQAQGLTAWEATSRYFGYFTIWTNLLGAINLSILLSFPVSPLGRALARPQVQSSLVVYLLVVSLGYNLLLRHLWEPQGLQFWVDELLHDVIPLLYLIYWLLFVLKGKLRALHPFSWLLYPAIYLLFVFARGSADGFYPYPFVNLNELGFSRVLIHAGWLSLGFLSLGFLIVLTDKILFRRNQRAVIS